MGNSVLCYAVLCCAVLCCAVLLHLPAQPNYMGMQLYISRVLACVERDVTDRAFNVADMAQVTCQLGTCALVLTLQPGRMSAKCQLVLVEAGEEIDSLVLHLKLYLALHLKFCISDRVWNHPVLPSTHLTHCV